MLQELDPTQLAAVKAINGPIIITAGPGTGKTRVLVNKILYLITSQQTDPSNILALTFTKKAAHEIKQRLTEYSLSKLPLVTTFHSLGYDILSLHQADIQIISEKARIDLIKAVARSLPEFKNRSVRELSLVISKYKGNVSHESQMQKLVAAYNHELCTLNVFDYDDLVLKALDLINTDTTLKQKLQQKFLYTLIDEFQDTNPAQYQLIKLISTRNICIIGDPLQSIYAFRGADSKSFDNFKEDYPKHTEINLTTNYRSTANIVSVSSRLFPDAVGLDAFTQEAGEVQLIQTLNAYTEASWILGTINKKIGGIDLLEAGNVWEDAATCVRFSDFGVIYRAHHLNNFLEKKFLDLGVPYQIVGSVSIYEQKEIAFVLACLNYLAYQDPSDLETADIKKLDALATGGLPQKFSELVAEIITIFDLKVKLQDKPHKLINLIQFNNTVLQFDEYPDAVKRFLDYIEGLKQSDFYDYQADKVTLLTMHAAKGLEFKYVFICGFEDGLIPLVKKDFTEKTLAEEKRLFYVAMTRARKGLYILSTKERGANKNVKISRFKDLISSSELQEYPDPVINKILKKRKIQKAKKAQMKLF